MGGFALAPRVACLDQDTTLSSPSPSTMGLLAESTQLLLEAPALACSRVGQESQNLRQKQHDKWLGGLHTLMCEQRFSWAQELQVAHMNV